MNYGPIAAAHERLVAHALERPKKDDHEGWEIWSRTKRRLSDEFQIAQDKFYDDVKSGRIIKEGE